MLLTNVLAAIAAARSHCADGSRVRARRARRVHARHAILVLPAALGSLGLGAAAAYHAARARWPKPVAFGNATLLGLLLGLAIVAVCGCVILARRTSRSRVYRSGICSWRCSRSRSSRRHERPGDLPGLQELQGVQRHHGGAGAHCRFCSSAIAIVGGGGVRAAIVATVAAASCCSRLSSGTRDGRRGSPGASTCSFVRALALLRHPRSSGERPRLSRLPARRLPRRRFQGCRSRRPLRRRRRDR